MTGPVNIGTGIETNVLELAEALGRLGGAEGFEPEFAPPRAGEVQRITLDAGRAERELGWRPADQPRRRASASPSTRSSRRRADFGTYGPVFGPPTADR